MSAGNLGLRNPRSIIQVRNALFSAFGGRVPLRPGTPKLGEKPYLIARIGINQEVLLEAAARPAAFCDFIGSGGAIPVRNEGRIWISFASSRTAAT